MQVNEQLKHYTIYYKDARGSKFCVTTKLCTKAAAREGWKDLNSLNTFKLSKIVAN